MNTTHLEPCRACGLPISTQAGACPRCGQPLPTVAVQNQAQSNQVRAGATLTIILLICFGGYWYSCENYKDFSRKEDQKFCKEWLGYYENFCKVYPDHCAEGPRKLAKCDP